MPDGFRRLFCACTAGLLMAWPTAHLSAAGPTADATTNPLVAQAGYPVKFVNTAPGDYFADFGLDWFGRAQLNINSPRAGARIVVMLGEKLRGRNRIASHPGGSIAFYQTRMSLRRGDHVYRVPLPGPDYRRMPAYAGPVMPFRYLQIRGCPATLTRHNVVQIRVHAPFDRAAAKFESSNPSLNAVWHLCHHTIEAVSFCGLFVDGNRERRPYEADDLIAELDWFNNTTGTSLPARSDAYLIYHPTWPTEWIMQCVQMAWYDYLYTGNKTFIRRNYAALKAKTLLALERPDGLISTVWPRVSETVLRSIFRHRAIHDIVDWPPVERDGYVMRPINTVVNAYHYRAMVLMARIAAALGHTRDSRLFKARARLVASSMNRLLLNRRTGLYVDGIGTEHSSEHANLFPLAFGLVPAADKAPVTAFLARQGMRCSVYPAQFLLEALYRAGDGGRALQLMASHGRHSWLHMLAEGSTITTEAWTFHSKPNEDWNHVWGSAPGNIIPRFLMGIRPLRPGFQRVILAPQPAGLKAAAITVPTVRGTIRESWQTTVGGFRLSFTIPPGMSAKLQLPPTLATGKTGLLDGHVVPFLRVGQWKVIDTIPAGKHVLKIP